MFVFVCADAVSYASGFFLFTCFPQWMLQCRCAHDPCSFFYLGIAFMTYFRLTCVAAAATLLVACGGSDDPARGALVDAPATVTTLTVAQLDAATASSGLQAISGKAKCDVKVVALNYFTPGVKAGEMSNASGVMLVPAGACTGPSALVANARGTEVSKTRTLANPQDGETFLLAAMYAA